MTLHYNGDLLTFARRRLVDGDLLVTDGVMVYCHYGGVCTAVGCPDIGEVDNAVVERRFDLAIIRCNVTTETYFLTCVNTRWTGEMSPCTAGITARCLTI